MTDSTSPQQIVNTRVGPVPVRVLGAGRPLVLVHGAFVDSRLWSPIVPALAEAHQVILPDLPMGAHRTPVPDRGALTAPGLAGAIGDVIDAVAGGTATLVGNDSGGALCQILAADRPDAIEALALTSCDAYDHFPPTLFKFIVPLLRLPGGAAMMGLLYRPQFVRRSLLGAGWVTKRLDPELLACFDDVAASSGARKDLIRLATTFKPALTHDAARRLQGWSKPALVAWSADDRFFPRSDGERLAATLGARFEVIPDSYTFSMQDQPARLSQTLLEWLETW